MKQLVIVLATICTITLRVVAGVPSSDLPSSWSREGDKPDGYLLGILGAAFYKLEFDGKVSSLWSYPLGNNSLYHESLFTVDVKNELVYLGTLEQFLALDLNTGEVKVEIPLNPPNVQYFWNYDYVAKENAIYGVCSGGPNWDWCRIKLHELHLQKVEFERFYEMPTEIIGDFSPASNVYDMDKEHQTIWYYSSLLDIFGINYTTGEFVFRGNDTLYNEHTFVSACCIAHDYSLNRTFTLHWDYLEKYPLLGEVHPMPRNATTLMKLPSSLRPVNYGSCAYYPKTHTMIVFMANITTYLTDSMSYYIVLIDVAGLTYEIVPLPGLRELTNTDWIISAIKFIPNKK